MGSCLSHYRFPERNRAHLIGDVLNLHLPKLLRPYIRQTLQTYLMQIRQTDMFLMDSQGQKLRFDPDNCPPPPRGQGVQLCFKAISHHSTKANTPIPINTVDEFSLLFCREFLKTKALTICTADSSSLLNMVARASCFPPEVRRKAALVRDEVRNLWAHSNYDVWTKELYLHSLEVVINLIIELPNHHSLVKSINLLK